MSKSKRPLPSPTPATVRAGRTSLGQWVVGGGIAAATLFAGAWWATRTPSYTRVATSATHVEASPKLQPIVEDEATAHAGYAGDQSCRACHAAAFEKWSASHHGLAERAPQAALDRAAFVPSQTIKHGSQESTAWADAFVLKLTTLGFDNRIEPYKIERVIGHEPLRQFLVAGTGGRLHTLEATWDPAKKEWFNVFGDEDRKPGEWGHWTGRGMVWNTQCASCHNTRVFKNYDVKTDTFHTSMAQMTVSCEACHGPMKPHVQWQAQHPNTKPDPTAVKLSRDAMRDTCAMCHARRTELTGDFKPGDAFFDHFQLAMVDHSDVFYPDGQVRDEDYEYTAFLGSRMHHAGVRCVDCHEPHTGKRLLQGNDLCMRCHTAGGYPNSPPIIPAAHTFHQPQSTGSQCVNCHMPQTVYMQRHPRHDHGFTIPDPLLTKQFGIPNACNRCHTDKDVDWALKAVEATHGPKMERRTRSRTTLMAKAKLGDHDARDGLVALLKSDETPYWKAAACNLLDQWTGSDEVRAALQTQLQHTDPLVRSAAVRALEPLMEGDPYRVRNSVEPLLADASRSVRIAAAWALRDRVDMASQAGMELQHMLEINADQPSGRMQRGQFHYARGEIPYAIAEMKKAVEWDAGSPPFHRDLAMMHSLAGDPASAIKALLEAIRLAPNDAEYRYLIGLAWHEMGDVDKTIEALRDAVRVEPRHTRAWYNLGLALNAKQQPDAALDALRQGEATAPRDASLPYAAATIHAQAGRKKEALEALYRALNAQPNMPEALELRAQLSR